MKSIKTIAETTFYTALFTALMLLALVFLTRPSRAASVRTIQLTVCISKHTTAGEMARIAREATRQNPNARVIAVFKKCLTPDNLKVSDVPADALTFELGDE